MTPSTFSSEKTKVPTKSPIVLKALADRLGPREDLPHYPILDACHRVRCSLSAATSADQFDWRNVNGQDFVSPVEIPRGLGILLGVAAIGTLEAKYKLTRNDPSFNIDLSEQNLICAVRQPGPTLLQPLLTNRHLHRRGTSLHAAITSPLCPLQSGWHHASS